jgi:hypothetical protein
MMSEHRRALLTTLAVALGAIVGLAAESALIGLGAALAVLLVAMMLARAPSSRTN